MKIKRFRSILALAVIATSVTANLSPAQAIPLDEILDSAGRSFVRGMFGLSEKQEAPSSSGGFGNGTSQQQTTPSSGGFGNDAPQQQTTPTNPIPQQSNNYYPSSPQSSGQKLAANCINANGNNFEAIDKDSPESNISVGRRPFRVFRKFNLSSWSDNSLEKTCRILTHPENGKIRVGYAIPDNSTLTRVRVSIYVDGQEKNSGILFVGQAKAFTADIAGANSYAVVVKPLDGSGYIYSLLVKQPE